MSLNAKFSVLLYAHVLWVMQHYRMILIPRKNATNAFMHGITLNIQILVIITHCSSIFISKESYLVLLPIGLCYKIDNTYHKNPKYDILKQKEYFTLETNISAIYQFSSTILKKRSSWLNRNVIIWSTSNHCALCIVYVHTHKKIVNKM